MKNPQIGALWLRKSQKNGSTYISGVIERDMAAALFMRAMRDDGDIRIVCFKAEKKNDKMPDFRIILSEPQTPKVVNDDFGDVFGADMSVNIPQKVKDTEIPIVENSIDDGEINITDIPF